MPNSTFPEYIPFSDKMEDFVYLVSQFSVIIQNLDAILGLRQRFFTVEQFSCRFAAVVLLMLLCGDGGHPDDFCPHLKCDIDSSRGQPATEKVADKSPVDV